MQKQEQLSEVLPPVEQNAEGIRQALFEEINLLRSGKVSTSHARALANLCRCLLDAAKLEIRHRKLLEKPVGKGRALEAGDGGKDQN